MNISMVNVMKVLAVALFVAFVMIAAPTAHAADLFEDYTGDVWYNDYSYTGDVWSNDYGYTGDVWSNDYGYTGDVWSNDWYDAGNNGSDWYDAGTADWYDAGYSYDYGCGSYCGGGSYDYGCGSSCYNYTTPGCSYCGGTSYSPPRYSPPVISQPAHSSSSYYSNTNTNTNVNNVTNIDNSIRDSFNNYNSNNTSLVVATPQYPVVYTAPAAPYCTITNTSTGYNYGSSVAYLSWTSTNATSAYLSNVGSVGVTGSQNVYPGGSTTYTLTVYGQNGQSATCSTNVYVNNYVPPVVNLPYVALTQIPYTGFDFGPIGNAIYWASLFSFAAAGAYLALYYRGGAFAFATNMIGTKQRKPLQPVVAPKAPILVEKEILAAAHAAEAKIQPVVAALRKAGTIDSMAIVSSKDGSMPKIVIERN